MIIAPAGHLPKEFESEAWWDDTGEKRKPRSYEVKFFHGEAETTDEIGRYLVKTGQAMKNRLVLPNSWNR